MLVNEPFLFLFKILIFPGLLTIVLLAFLFEWAYRKLLARFQSRKGPMEAGPHGILQTIADFIKVGSKEEIIPESAHKFIFRYLPVFAPVPVLIAIFFIPITSKEAIISSPGDLYFIIFFLSAFAAIQITLGWASGSRYAMVGASRAGLQLVSFGIPLVFASIVPAIRAGSFNLQEIVEYQTGTYQARIFGITFSFIPRWTIFGVGFFAFMVFLICGLAELEKVPFDTPEAETELAGGWTLEYSGRLYAFILLSEQLKEVLLIGLAVTLFLGGPSGWLFGLTNPYAIAFLHFIYFLLKSLVVLLILSLLSASMARFKIGQIIEGTWSFLAPFSVILVGLLIIIGW